MQQTDKYKLNKPGIDDPLAIAPLNENADKIEAAITAETAALDSRVTVLEAKYFVSGTFIGDGQSSQFINLGFTPKAVLVHHEYIFIGDGQSSQFINLGFTPKAVLVHHEYIAYYTALAVAGQSSSNGPGTALEVVENGFKVHNSSPSASIKRNMNENGQSLNYIAFT